MKARWIRLGAIGQRDFDAAWTALAAAQPRDGAPVLLWGEEAARYPFALIAPLKHAPGRVQRWLAWGLAAAVAIRPMTGLLLFVAAWKLGTEFLFVTAGAPIWEFVERAGSYAAPLALAILMRERRPNR